MFEIGLIYWLQSFASPLVTWLMSGVTQLGYRPVYVALLLFLAFVVRLRPTLGILLGLLLAGVLTEGLKTAIAFPRPSDIDARVLEYDANASGSPTVLDTHRFWSLPSAEAREAIRATPDASYGFPSGHVSAATAFCLGVMLFFRWRPFVPFGAAWPLVMALSRMYLGRHFLADVIGGLGLGVVAAGSAALLLRWLDHPAERSPRRLRIATACAATMGLAVLSLFTQLLDSENVGGLVGLVSAYAVLTAVGLPDDAGRLWQRAGRFLTAVLIYLALSHLLRSGLEVSGWEDRRLPEMLVAAVILAGTLVGGVTLGRRLRLYGVT